jgi:hypothetical protein
MSHIVRKYRKAWCLAGCMAMLSACGGGGSSGTPTPPTGGVSPTPTPTTSACSLSARQSWVRGQIDEWYLFPDLLNLSASPGNYATLQGYVDALVAPARAQNRDR